jgi:hypothetical protein
MSRFYKYKGLYRSVSRVSFETSSDSKQPKLEPNLVSALSETKCLFRLFRFYTKTESFGVSIEPKQAEQPKQFNREHVLVFFHKILCCFGLFRFVSVCFEFFTETASFDASIEPKQTEDQPKQFHREHILVFFRKFRAVSVFFGLIRNSSVCFGCFDIGSKHRNKPKHDRNRSCFGSNRKYFVFVSRTP